MAHINDGSAPRQVEETQVTTRRGKSKGRIAAAVGVTVGGVAAGAGLLTGNLDPEVTSAVVAVVTITGAVVARLIRRTSGAVEAASPVEIAAKRDDDMPFTDGMGKAA